MLKFVKKLIRKPYFPLNTIEVSRSALEHNYRYLSEIDPKIAVAPVLKSNAYGHGLTLAASVFDQLSAPFLCVDGLHEAYELHKDKIKTPILIMGYIDPKNLAVKRLPFWYAAFTSSMLHAIAKHQGNSPVHIFVDTGMHREGVQLDQLRSFLSEAKALGIKIEGIMSHLGKGYDAADPSTRKQINNFKDARDILADSGIVPKWAHIAASSGLLNSRALGELGNVARVGTAVYGIDAEGRDKKLRPALSLHTTIAQVKNIESGSKLGYDFTYTAKRRMKVAVLPLGYNDGVDRKLSNIGVVGLKEKLCPIVGRVSMNITLVDVSEVHGVKEGDAVAVYSDNNSERNSISQAADVCGAIPYELLVGLNPDTRRILVP